MNKTEKKLLNLFADLDKDDQSSVMAFTEFLLNKAKQEGRHVEIDIEPVHIPRPKEERVVAAIKRLSAVYPMIKKDSMLNETANLMTEHMIHGRPAVEIIDELEILFQSRYEEFCQLRSSEDGFPENASSEKD